MVVGVRSSADSTKMLLEPVESWATVRFRPASLAASMVRERILVEVDSGEGIDVLVKVGPVVLNAVREVILDGINLGTDGHRKGRKAKQQGGQKGVRSGLHGGYQRVTA